jgi:mannose-1-phosphate guanylyltransferase/mannose-1-phosphate guanylyltransferase/mannose-6-phosphate isomerase
LAPGLFSAEAFVEKPPQAVAERYLADGEYLWNAGIFMFRAAAYLEALRAFEPAIHEAARDSIARGRQVGSRVHPDEASFASAPARSIDHAVMEQASHIAVVPIDMDWSDVGTWDALYEAGTPDSGGNVVEGDALAIDSAGSLLRSEGPRIVTLGVRDLIVVATADTVLVMPRGESQRVRDAVDAVAHADAKERPV